jgi:hypothetical protein
VTTTRRRTNVAPTRREVLMSVGALAIGVAGGTVRTAPRPNWPIWSVEGAGGQGYLVGETYPRSTDWHDKGIEALVPGCSMLRNETNQIIRGDLKELVTRNGIDDATPLMVRLGADDRARLEKGSCALQRTDGQSNELPAMACRSHAGIRLLSGNGPNSVLNPGEVSA